MGSSMGLCCWARRSALWFAVGLASGVVGCGGTSNPGDDAAVTQDVVSDVRVEDASGDTGASATTDSSADAPNDVVLRADAPDAAPTPDAPDVTADAPAPDAPDVTADAPAPDAPDVTADAPGPDVLADVPATDVAADAPMPDVAADVRALDVLADVPATDVAADVRDASVDAEGFDAILEIASAESFTCARRASGTVWCWGEGNQGQLGDGANIPRQTPVRVMGITDAVEIVTGTGFGCARRANGSVVCWGEGRSGQLGVGMNLSVRQPPTTVSDLSDATQLSAGSTHTCARRASGAVVCWGSNANGQIGDGTSGTNRLVPTAVIGITDAVEVTAGGNHTCARRASGSVVCWGGNANGQIGDGTSGSNRLVPAAVMNLTDAAELIAGQLHTCARRASGAVLCWGGNTRGQLGDGTSGTNRLVPTAVTGLADATQLDSGETHTCARRANGSIACWGNNTEGQIGDATLGPNRLSPTPVAGISDATEVSAGASHGCARRGTSGVSCWGDGLHGQYGDGQGWSLRPLPTPVANLTDAVQITAGLSHACARRATSVVCWGRNDGGQLGDGTSLMARLFAVPVASLTDAVEVVAGWAHTCARRATGSVVCWGDNRGGQIGDGTTRVNRLSPTAVLNITDAEQVALGSFNTCVRRAGGAVLCWGDNLFGQVGNGTNGNFSVATPTPVSNLTDAREVAAGWTHVCARRPSGAVLCWGNNSEGQLGDNTAMNRSVPTPVSGITDAVEIGIGMAHTCARRAGGTVSCWGRNGSGQLGNGTTTASSVPTAVMGLSDAVQLSVGMNANCARRRNNTVVCWGPGLNPDGTGRNDQVPTQVVGLTDAVEIAVGDTAQCARRANGSVVCWGSNDLGQIGMGPLRDVAFAR